MLYFPPSPYKMFSKYYFIDEFTTHYSLTVKQGVVFLIKFQKIFKNHRLPFHKWPIKLSKFYNPKLLLRFHGRSQGNNQNENCRTKRYPIVGTRQVRSFPPGFNFGEIHIDSSDIYIAAASTSRVFERKVQVRLVQMHRVRSRTL